MIARTVTVVTSARGSGAVRFRISAASGRSLSAVGTSPRIDWNLPSVGGTSAQIAADRANGLVIRGAAEMGMNINWGGLDLASDPVRVNGHAAAGADAYAAMLRQINGPQANPWDPPMFDRNNPWNDRPLAESAHDLAEAMYGPLWSDRPYALRHDPYGSDGRFSGGARVGSIWDVDTLTLALRNGQGGLDRLLAQPFNVLLTWGAGALDLDLHMTGPSGIGQTDRFHIYYAARGSLAVFPFAELIKDCICRSGSEVILTTQLIRGGVYRISVFNFGDQSGSSTNLSSAAGAQLQVVRGGQAVSQGDGTTIVGGHVIYTGAPPPGQPGNTWVAVEIDPNTGHITAPNTVTQNAGSPDVH